MITNLKSRRSKLEIDRSPLSPVEKELMQGVRAKIAAAGHKKVHPNQPKNAVTK
ncbi:MAG: hypothetical protein WCT04_10945 [Planctomycetota bacterium]